MFRVTSLTHMDDRRLAFWTKRLALLLIVGIVGFTAFYLFDRWRPATPAIVDQRLGALEAAVRKDPNDIVSRGQLADTYVAKHRYEDAIAQYDAILKANKDVELATMGRGMAYLGLEQYEKAQKDFQAVVDIAKGGEMANVDTMLEAAYYQLGYVALKQNRTKDAITELGLALSIKRSDADAMYLIGQAYTADGQYDKAETTLRAAVAFVPIGWAEPYTALAAAYTKAGNPAEAEWASAMADLAAKKSEGVESRLKALATTPAAVDAAVGLGLLYESRGDSASAAEWYTKALAVDPNNDEARLGMSRVGSIKPASALPSLPVPGGH